MRASQPQALNCARVNSALALSCGEPTWLGCDDICCNRARIAAADRPASNFASSARCAAELSAEKPSSGGPDGAGEGGGAAIAGAAIAAITTPIRTRRFQPAIARLPAVNTGPQQTP